MKWFAALVSLLMLFSPIAPRAYAQEATPSAVAETPTPTDTPPPEPTPTVVLNETYQYGSGVSVTFTRLPDPAGTLSIAELHLTQEQMDALGALSDTAYDITSSMENGTFTYNLTLPVPPEAQGKNVEVKADGEVVGEPKTREGTTITITGLTHFTVFVLAGPASSGTGGSGDVSWSATDNIYASDNTRATVALLSGETSNNLKATGFGFSVPSNATIEGVEVNIERSVDTSRTNASKDNRVKLIIDGSATGDNKAAAGYFNNTTDDITVYGSPTDLWGLSLTPNQVNASNFGVAYSAARHPSGTSPQSVRIDQIQLIIYYNTPPAISVLSPNGAEAIAGGSQYPITWSASDPDHGDVLTISLEYTTDGATYTHIANGLANGGTYDWTVPAIDATGVSIRATASDGAMQTSDESDAGFTIDITPPVLPSADPGAGDYMTDQTVTLSSADAGSGLAAIYYTLDGTDPDTTKTLYTAPVPIDHSLILKAIAYDNAGNASDTLAATFGIAPVISDESASRGGDTSFIVTWATDDPATSRVVYDTVSHPSLGSGENFGYASSSAEDATLVTSHAVVIGGLSTNVTYYYRTISHGSPDTVGEERSYTPFFIFGVGGGDGKSDGRSDGQSDGGSSGGGGGGSVASVLGTTLTLIPNVLGATIVDTAQNARPTPTPMRDIIEKETVLGESTATLPWWPFTAAGLLLLVCAWWYSARKRVQ